MSDVIELPAEPREKLGSRHSIKLRGQGRLPAIVYGHKETPESIHVSTEAIQDAIKHNTSAFDLKTDGKSQKVIIKDLQWDHLGIEILHIDFQRVSADERVEAKVEVRLTGESPGVMKNGVLDHQMHDLNIECAALDQPDFIEVDIGELNIGDSIHLKDLKLPKGVKALDDPDMVVVQVNEAQAVPAEDEEPAAGGEPEIIGRPAEGDEGAAE